MISEKVSILVVDDSAMERLIVSHVLRKDPRFVVTALTCGQEALEYVEVHRPCMIVTDLRMPGMSGLEVIENLRNAGQSIPVVLMTSCVSEDLVLQAFKAGAASYVPKEVLESSLLKTIQRALILAEQRKFRQQTLAEFTIADWSFAMESDPDSVPYLIRHLLDLAVQASLSRGCDAALVFSSLKRVMSMAAATGILEFGGRLREVLESVFVSSEVDAVPA
jgi:hypothetical protein